MKAAITGGSREGNAYLLYGIFLKNEDIEKDIIDRYQ